MEDKSAEKHFASKTDQIRDELAKVELAEIKRLEFDLAMLRYRKNPDIWLKERLGEAPHNILWHQHGGYDNHVLDGTENPLYAVWKSVADGYWTALMSATGTGKTYILARIVLWYLDCFDNPLVVTTAPKEGQLKLHLWSELSRIIEKYRRIRPGAKMTTLRLQKNQYDAINGQSAEAIGFVSGTGSAEESATKAQGFHRENMLIIIEETPGVRDAVMTAFVNTSTNIGSDGRAKNIILAVGNPDSEDDPLCQFSKLDNVKAFRASANDHPNVVCNKELIPGAVTRGSIKVRENRFGYGTPMYNSRVRGIPPPESASSLFKGAWIDFALDKANHNDETIPFDHGYHAIGLDAAQSESGDSGGAAFGKGNILCELHEFACPNATHLGYNILLPDYELLENGFTNYNIPTTQDYEVFDFCVGVDTVGVGAATINALHDGYNNLKCKAISLMGGMLESAVKLDDEGKPLVSFASLRAQMYWELREDLREHKIRIEIYDERIIRQLKKELIAHSYSTKGGKVTVEPKEKVKEKLRGKSPTYSDIMAYWNWMRKGYYANGGYSGISAG